MRPLVRSAVQTSKVVERKARNAELESKKKKEAQNGRSQTSKLSADGEAREQSPQSPSDTGRAGPKTDKNAERQKDFETYSTSAPRRLNDVAQAPPDIKKAPRGAVRLGIGGKREGVLSMAQKSMMEQEREKAIARYRMLKAARLQPAEG